MVSGNRGHRRDGKEVNGKEAAAAPSGPCCFLPEGERGPVHRGSGQSEGLGSGADRLFQGGAAFVPVPAEHGRQFLGTGRGLALMTGNHEHQFALDAGRHPVPQFGQGAGEPLFVQLGQFAEELRLALAKNGAQILKAGVDAVRGFVKDEWTGQGGQPAQELLSGRRGGGQESAEIEIVALEPGQGQGCHQGAGAWHGRNRDARRSGQPDQYRAGS